MDPNQDQNQQPNQQFTPDNPVPPNPPQQPVEPPQPPVPQTAEPTPPPQEEETPAYLKGADGPPAPGQATHPPGGYQPQAGETVQAGIGGGAVVQRAPGEENQVPAQVQPQPGAQQPAPQPMPPPQPQVQPQQPMAQPQMQQPQVDVNSVLQDEQSRLGGLFAGLDKKVLIGIVAVVLVPLLAAIIFSVFSGDDGDTVVDQDQALASDLQVLYTGIENYNADNNRYPTLGSEDVASLSSNYLPEEFNDPRTGRAYVITTDAPTDSDIQYVLGGKCGDNESIVRTNNTEEFALRVNLTDSLYCIDNQ